MPEIKIQGMTLSNKEKAIVVISNAIDGYSFLTKKEALPENSSLIDFILKMAPNELKSMITIDLIDDVFEYISKNKMDDS